MSLLLLFAGASSGIAPPPSTDGQTILMPGKASGASFSRKRFDEIRAAQRAQEEAAQKALELTASKQQRKLERAAQSAAVAIEAVGEEAEGVASQLASMTAALEGAANAVKAKEIIRQARAAENFALAIMRHLEDQNDDEAAIMLLMQ